MIEVSKNASLLLLHSFEVPSICCHLYLILLNIEDVPFASTLGESEKVVFEQISGLHPDIKTFFNKKPHLVLAKRSLA